MIGNNKPKIEPWHITPEEEAIFRATDATFEWLCDMPKELLHRYAGHWVAAKDCQIIAAGKTMDEMLTNLGNVDIQTVVLHRIERPGWTIRR